MRSSSASRTRRAGGSRSPARRTRRSRTTSTLGFKSIYLGDEAVIRPSEFSLEGTARSGRCGSRSRGCEKGGYEVRVLSTADCRRRPARRAARGLRGVARQLARARLHDGDGRALPLPGHGARRRDRARTGAVGGFLQLVPSPASEGYSLASMRRRKRHAERADGVPDHRDGRLGARARRHRGVAQLRGLRRLPARRRGRRRARRARCGGCC